MVLTATGSLSISSAAGNWAGLGPTGGFAILRLRNDPSRLYLYSFFGGLIGSNGLSGSAELGFVWATPTPESYAGKFWTASLALLFPDAANVITVGKFLPMVWSDGVSGSLFWSPEYYGSYGFSFGLTSAISEKSQGASLNYSTSFTHYTLLGMLPFSIDKLFPPGPGGIPQPAYTGNPNDLQAYIHVNGTQLMKNISSL
jgi:hypothetical protein